MYLEIIFLGVGTAVAVAACLSSKFVRAVCREIISHPRDPCEIQVRGKNISISRVEAEQKLEGR
jgi:hypothetical protein